MVDGRMQFLMPEDSYFAEQVSILAEKMLHKVHVLGEGLKYIEIDLDLCELISIFSQDNAEWHQQFSAGIKTIAIISVSPNSVVQFGSTQKRGYNPSALRLLPSAFATQILESVEFLDLVKSLFQQLESVSGSDPSGNSLKVVKIETCSPPPVATSLSILSSSNTCFSNATIKSSQENSIEEFKVNPQCLINMAQSCNLSTSGLHKGSLQPHAFAVPLIPSSTIYSNNSFPLTNHRQMAGSEAQIILSSSSMLPTMAGAEPNSQSAKRSALNIPSSTSLSSELSALTSMELQLLSRMGNQGCPNIFPLNLEANVSCGKTFSSLHGDAILNQLLSTNGSAVSMLRTGNGGGKLTDRYISSLPASERQPSTEKSNSMGASLVQQVPKGPAGVLSFLEEFTPVNATTALHNPNLESKPNHWSSLRMDHANNSFITPLNEDLLQALSVNPSTSGYDAGDVFSSILTSEGPRSVQNFIGCGRDSLSAVSDGKENYPSVAAQISSDNNLFDTLGLDLKQSQGQLSWDDMSQMTLPIGSSSQMNQSGAISGTMSELYSTNMTGPQKGFFSDSGLEQLLDAVVGNVKSITNHSSDDWSSTTTVTRAGNSSVYSNQVPLRGISCLNGNIDAVPPECSSDKTANGSQKEAHSKSMVSSWIDSSCNVTTESATVSQHKKPEEPPKNIRKRARPGESTRPRPKDRQQIQDRVKELREIVPNGAKCSIDALLDRTIKHMLFLQSVTKYADKLKQVDEPKGELQLTLSVICTYDAVQIVGKDSGIFLKDSSSSGGASATWAFEVEGQTMVCPIIVEDLNPPGQMLVEMLCEERGFFLEIADIIRDFGLTILKGVMEARENKIWARFVVEANREVTRMDVFLSLVKLLQQSTSSGSQPMKVVESGVPMTVRETFQRSDWGFSFELFSKGGKSATVSNLWYREMVPISDSQSGKLWS
ncbi:hypothetical protein ACLOJK_005009 [Asimina triloba]